MGLYVQFDLNKGQRSLCAKLHLGLLTLALESSRFNDTPEEDRHCLLCETENEFNFLVLLPCL